SPGPDWSAASRFRRIPARAALRVDGPHLRAVVPRVPPEVLRRRSVPTPLTAAGGRPSMPRGGKVRGPAPGGGNCRGALTSMRSLVVRERVLRVTGTDLPSKRVSGRPSAPGKFLYEEACKLWVRGVTYGTFAPNRDGSPFPLPARVESDFVRMRAAGVNAVRTYTPPPPSLLDLAREDGLRVMVGLAWESHVDFLAGRKRARSIEAMVRQGVRSCGGHPAVLCYALGNEIPSSIVRWIGPRRVEGFLERLFAAAKSED